MEEFEKNDSRVPKWKVEWVRENLLTMIGKDDTGLAKKKTSVGGKLTKKKSTLRKLKSKNSKTAQKKQVEEPEEDNNDDFSDADLD